MNPTLGLRMMLRDETGDAERYFPAPKPSAPNKEQTTKDRKTVHNKRGDNTVEVQHAVNEMNEGYTQVGATADAVIDVTEDDEEGSTTDSTGEQEQATYQQPNFRLAADNITPLIEQSKALEEKLRNGTDGHDVMHEVLRVLTDIRKLDPIRYGIEIDRLVAAENAGKKRGQAKFSEKKLEQALKAFAEREAAELLTQMTTVGEMWPDAPEEQYELPLPTGYRYSENGVERIVSMAQGFVGYESLTPQPIYVSGWQKDVATDYITAVITTWTPDKGWVDIPSDLQVLLRKDKVTELAPKGVAIGDDCGALATYLNRCYNVMRSEIKQPPDSYTSCAGWIEGMFVFSQGQIKNEGNDAQ